MKGLVTFVFAICLLFKLGLVCALEITSDDFQKLVRRLERLENDNQELKQRVVSLERTVMVKEKNRKNRFVMDSMEGAIAFTAGISPYYVDDMDPKNTIVFETTITDIGGAYNNVSGIFTAPRNGVYVFSCSLIDHYQHGLMLHAEIVKDHGSVLGRVFAHAEQDSYRDQGAQTVVTHLNAGDEVWVRIWDSQNLSLGGQLYSTFTGYLLYSA